MVASKTAATEISDCYAISPQAGLTGDRGGNISCSTAVLERQARPATIISDGPAGASENPADRKCSTEAGGRASTVSGFPLMPLACSLPAALSYAVC